MATTFMFNSKFCEYVRSEHLWVLIPFHNAHLCVFEWSCTFNDVYGGYKGQIQPFQRQILPCIGNKLDISMKPTPFVA